MKYRRLIICIVLSLTACGTGMFQPTPTATNIPSPTIMPTYTPQLPTEIPPIPTEAAAALVLDKPMTTEFDPENTAVMPTINEEQNKNVSSGALATAVDNYWRQDGATYDANGNVVLPAGVQPVKPDEWRTYVMTANNPAKGEIQLDWKGAENCNIDNCALQRSPLQFKVVDPSGNVKGILLTEKLYYYDKQGTLHVTPAFFYVDYNMMEQSASIGPMKIKVAIVYNQLGYMDKVPPGVQSGGHNVISIPVLGKQAGTSITDSTGLVDIEGLLSEPMQTQRDEIIKSLEDGSFDDPSILSKIWSIDVAPLF